MADECLLKFERLMLGTALPSQQARVNVTERAVTLEARVGCEWHCAHQERRRQEMAQREETR